MEEEVKNKDSLFYLLGAVLGGLIAGLTAESFWIGVIGVIVGFIFALFFVKVLLPQREHDR